VIQVFCVSFNELVLKSGYAMFKNNSQKTPSIDIDFVSPVRGLEEVNLLLNCNKAVKNVFDRSSLLALDESASMVDQVFLIVKRLKKGGTAQPKSVFLRQALHQDLPGSIYIKVFISKRLHGFICIQDPIDIAEIKESVKKLTSLAEAEEVSPNDLYNQVQMVKLEKPISLKRIVWSRNLLGLKYNPLESIKDFHRHSMSLYTNPQTRKKDSAKSKSWIDERANICNALDTGACDDKVMKLFDASFIVPVDGVRVIEGGYEISIFESDQFLFLKDMISHDGGVILYRFEQVDNAWKVERLFRVHSTISNKRDLAISPRTAPTRYNILSSISSNDPKPGMFTEDERHESNLKAYRKLEEIQASFEKSTVDVGEALAFLSCVAGSVDSPASIFSPITGITSVA
jgi:hypothetical protein